MLTEERHDIIRTRLETDGRVIATDLAQFFDVSEDTIRRDLRDLAKSGFCRRVYGGALAPAPPAGPIATRIKEASASKTRLAEAAARLAVSGQTIFLDAGSTNLAIATAIPRDMALTIVTNAPAIALALADHAARVVMLGGSFDATLGACLGGTTLREIETINADLFFLGSCGVDPAAGITAFVNEEAEVKRAMLRASAALAIAATTDKLATAAPFRVAAPADITHLIVGPDASTDLLTAFRRNGTAIHQIETP